MSELNYYKDLNARPIVPPIGATVTFSEYTIWHGLTGEVVDNDPSLLVRINDGSETVIEIVWRNHINIIAT